jgi:hypothetical protein
MQSAHDWSLAGTMAAPMDRVHLALDVGAPSRDRPAGIG